MITINVIENQICGSYGETPFAVEYTKEVYDIMQQHAVMAEQVETVEEYNKIKGFIDVKDDYLSSQDKRNHYKFFP